MLRGVTTGYMLLRKSFSCKASNWYSYYSVFFKVFECAYVTLCVPDEMKTRIYQFSKLHGRGYEIKINRIIVKTGSVGLREP